MIALLEKKDKDNRLIKNWRPISLINVDTKVASKALAKRLEPILPDLIHYNQSAYVQGRSIFDAIRAIDDEVQYTKQIDTCNFCNFILIYHKIQRTIKRDSYTKANKSGEEAQKETMRLIDIGLPQSKNKVNSNSNSKARIESKIQ